MILQPKIDSNPNLIRSWKLRSCPCVVERGKLVIHPLWSSFTGTENFDAFNCIHYHLVCTDCTDYLFSFLNTYVYYCIYIYCFWWCFACIWHFFPTLKPIYLSENRHFWIFLNPAACRMKWWNLMSWQIIETFLSLLIGRLTSGEWFQRAVNCHVAKISMLQLWQVAMLWVHLLIPLFSHFRSTSEKHIQTSFSLEKKWLQFREMEIRSLIRLLTKENEGTWCWALDA